MLHNVARAVLTSVPSGIFIHPAVSKSGGSCSPFGVGAGSPSNTMYPSNTMWSGQRSISVPSGVLIHPAVWPQQTYIWVKNWGVVPLLEAAGFPCYTMWPGPCLPPYQVASLSIQPFRKVGAAVPLSGWELGPHLTQCRHGSRLASVPSGILMYPSRFIKPASVNFESVELLCPFPWGSWIPI